MVLLSSKNFHNFVSGEDFMKILSWHKVLMDQHFLTKAHLNHLSLVLKPNLQYI